MLMTDNTNGADEFDLFALYPTTPGHRGADTSIAAAADIAPEAPTIRRRALEIIADAGPAGKTAEELADALAMARVSVQPRTSELKALGKIAVSKLRRPNASSGKLARVWVLPQYAEREAAHG
jgi:hypothetical protein